MSAGTAQNTLHALSYLIPRTNEKGEETEAQRLNNLPKAFNVGELQYRTDCSQSSIFAYMFLYVNLLHISGHILRINSY